MKCDYYNSKNSDTLSSSLNIRGQKETQQLTLSPYKILELNCCQCKKRKFFLKKMIVPNQANVRLAFSSSEIHSSKTNLSHPFPLTRSSEFFSTNHTMKACSLLKKMIILMFFSSNTPRQKIIPQFYFTVQKLIQISPKISSCFFSLLSMRRRKNKRQAERRNGKKKT